MNDDNWNVGKKKSFYKGHRKFAPFGEPKMFASWMQC